MREKSKSVGEPSKADVNVHGQRKPEACHYGHPTLLRMTAHEISRAVMTA
jgi:hypothetical protein